MIHTRTCSGRQLSTAVLTLAVTLLAGCISVFPKSEPAQLYRFGEPASSAPPTQNAGGEEAAFNVFLGKTEFNRAAAGDRILTISGNQAAYIKGARWVTSAEDLFGSALRQALSENPGAAQLVGSDGTAHVDYLLTIQVQTFEARYLNGPEAAPDIMLAVHALLTDTGNRNVVAEQVFRLSISTDENRVGSIVEGFDQATGHFLADLVKWINTQGAAANH